MSDDVYKMDRGIQDMWGEGRLVGICIGKIK